MITETEHFEEKQVTGVNPDQYWALLEPEKLVPEVRKRRREFLEFFKDSGILSRIRTSYCYYHGLYYNGQMIGDARISCGGEENEWDLVAINQFRSVLGLLKTYVCAPDIAWDALAKKSSYSTVEATKQANEMLDCLSSSPDSGLQQCRKLAVEEAIVLSAGYGWVYYDETLGEEKDADQDGTIYREGDFRYLNPSFLDVGYSLDAVEMNQSPWVVVRRKEFKFDLVAQHPNLKEEILKGSSTSIDGLDDIFELGSSRVATAQKTSDTCWVYYFYHRQTPALPNGRYVRFVSEKAVLKDGELEGCVPVHQLLPAKWLLTSFGYSMSWDLAGAQEALHLAANTIVTNQDKFGGCHVQFPAGQPVRIGEIEGVGTVFQTDGDIKSVQLLNNPAELFKSVEMWGGTIEKISGINAAARGQPTPSMHAARAIEFTEQRTQQAVSDLVANVRQFTAELGTSTIRILAHVNSENRDYTTTSASGQKRTKSISKEVLKSLDKVAIVEGNPKLGTIEGRVQFAESLLERGVLKDVAKITNVMKTGDLKPLTDLDEGQESLIMAENELLMEGQEIPPPADYDYHPGHARGHFAALSTPQKRGDPAQAPYLASHLAQHFEKMEDPMIMARLAIMYPNEPPIPALPPSVPPGAPQGQIAPPASPGGPPMPPAEPKPTKLPGPQGPGQGAPPITPAAQAAA